MATPMLFDLSANKVAEHFFRFSTETVFDSKVSNAVFHELLLQNEYNIYMLGENKNQFNMSELDLRKCHLSVNDIKALSEYNLTFLSLGSLYSLEKHFPDKNNIKAINIISLLKTALNEKSQKELIHLDISGFETLSDKWPEQIANFLPALQSMAMREKRFKHHVWFSKFCMSLPNLKVLDISSTNLQTLKGINKLENLEILKMCNLKFRNGDALKELSELKKLKLLDVSYTVANFRFDFVPPRIMNQLLEAEVEIENLQFLDCSQTIVRQNDLKEFIEKHPKLKTIVTMGTETERPSIKGIELINFRTVASTLKSIEYGFSMEREHLVRLGLEVIVPREDFIKSNRTDISKCLKTLCDILNNPKVMDVTKQYAASCFTDIFKTENIGIFYYSEVEHVLNSLFGACRTINEEQFQFSVVVITFGIIDEILKTKCPTFLMDLICLETMELLVNMPMFEISYAVDLLSNIVHKMSVDLFQLISEKTNYVTRLFRRALQIYEDQRNGNYGKMMKVLMEFTNVSEASRMELLKENRTIELIEHYNYYKHDTIVQINLLKLLKNLNYSMNDEEMSSCYSEENIKILTESMNTDNTVYENAIGLFTNAEKSYQIYSIISFLLAKNQLSSPEEMNQRLKNFCLTLEVTLKLHIRDVDKEHIEKALLEKDSKGGSISWALLTIKNLIANDKEFIKKFNNGNLKELVERICVDSNIEKEIKKYARNLLEDAARKV